MDGRPELDRFLRTDPQDVGCAQVTDMLPMYAELADEDIDRVGRLLSQASRRIADRLAAQN